MKSKAGQDRVICVRCFEKLKRIDAIDLMYMWS